MNRRTLLGTAAPGLLPAPTGCARNAQLGPGGVHQDTAVPAASLPRPVIRGGGAGNTVAGYHPGDDQTDGVGLRGDADDRAMAGDPAFGG